MLINQENSKIIKIKFKFKSFHYYQFKTVTSKILAKTRSLDLDTKGFVSLPTKIQRMTVLRSPHVDKKSREQFELKVYSKLLTVKFNLNNNFDKHKAKLLINFIKNSSSGLNLKVIYTI